MKDSSTQSDLTMLMDRDVTARRSGRNDAWV